MWTGAPKICPMLNSMSSCWPPQHYNDPEWRHCHSLRLVSRPMYEIATPFLYRYLSLSQKRLEQLSTLGQYHDLLPNIQAYTRIVSLPSGENLEAAIGLLSGCHQLKVLRQVDSTANHLNVFIWLLTPLLIASKGPNTMPHFRMISTPLSWNAGRMFG